MKKVLSISIGASDRDHQVETEILGERFLIARRGTNGDIAAAAQMVKELDGQYDAFGLGGIDMWLGGFGDKRYGLRAAKQIVDNAVKTPMVDGTELKWELERHAVHSLNEQPGFALRGRKVLVTCALDRFGMAQGFIELGADILFGDAMMAIDLPLPIHSTKTLKRMADVFMPVVSRLPFSMIYPTGDKQRETTAKYRKYFDAAEIIAGDYLYIQKHMPDDLTGKAILTNTVTSENVEQMRRRGLSLLVTSTPAMEGRSFGTNVLQACFVALLERSPEQIASAEYLDLMRRAGFSHRIERFDVAAAPGA